MKQDGWIVDLDRLSIERVENLETRRFGLRTWKYFDGLNWVSFGNGTNIGVFDDEKSAVRWLLQNAYDRREAALEQLEKEMKVFAFAHKVNAAYLMRQKQTDATL